MPEQPNPLEAPTNQNTQEGRGRQPKSRQDRNYFHKVQPTFTVASTATKLEFVDNSDPKKDLVVRKKAREWVHRNRETARKKTKGGEQSSKSQEEEALKQVQMFFNNKGKLLDPGSGRVDPFDILPNVGRKIDHIFEYFLTQCPEEVPCSDDTFAWRPRSAAVVPSRANTVLGTMANERISFILWLHATTVIRDGMLGDMSQEAMYYYNMALKAMRDELNKRKVEQYSDSFIASLGCFAACANFVGDFPAAKLHCDALVKAVTLRGGGDLFKGVKMCSPWVQKGMQWCELHVAAQTPAAPVFPFNPPPPPEGDVTPESMFIEADYLTDISLLPLGPLSPAFQGIVSQLHLLCLIQQSSNPRSTSTSRLTWAPYRIKIHHCAIRPLYCAEYAILQLLGQQAANSEHGFTTAEVVLTEACHCFLWPGLRNLPCEMKLCDLLVTRLKIALSALLREMSLQDPSSRETSFSPAPRSSYSPAPPSLSPVPISISPAPSSSSQFSSNLSHSSSATDYSTTDLVLRHPLDGLLIWALFVGTLVSGVGPRPEHGWFKDQLLRQVLVKNARTIKSTEDLAQVLRIFPWTDAFCGDGLPTVNIPF